MLKSLAHGFLFLNAISIVFEKIHLGTELCVRLNVNYVVFFIFGEYVETTVFCVCFPGDLNPCVPNPCGEASCIAEDGVAMCQGESQITKFSPFTSLMTSDV